LPIALIVGGVFLYLNLTKENEAEKLLKETFSSNRSVPSGKLTFNVFLKTEGGPLSSTEANPNNAVSLNIDGPFENRTAGKLPKFSFNTVLTAQNQSVSSVLTSTADKGFAQLQGTTYRIPPDVFRAFKEGFEAEANSEKTGNKKEQSQLLDFESLGIKPLDLITTPVIRGPEKIAGSDTTHISASIDKNVLAQTLLRDTVDESTTTGSTSTAAPATTTTAPTAPVTPSTPGTTTAPTAPKADQSKDAQTKQIVSAIDTASVDVWTNKSDTTLRKLRVHFVVNIPADQQSKLQGTTKVDLTLNLELTEVGKQQSIVEPPDTKSLDELLAQPDEFLSSFQILSVFGDLINPGAVNGTPTTTPENPITTPTTTDNTLPGITTVPSTTGDTTEVPVTPTPSNNEYADCVKNANGDTAALEKCAALINPDGGE